MSRNRSEAQLLGEKKPRILTNPRSLEGNGPNSNHEAAPVSTGSKGEKLREKSRGKKKRPSLESRERPGEAKEEEWGRTRLEAKRR